MSFHNHSFHSTLYLLTTQLGVHRGLMPFMPIQGMMTFSNDQQHLVEWYTTCISKLTFSGYRANRLQHFVGLYTAYTAIVAVSLRHTMYQKCYVS